MIERPFGQQMTDEGKGQSRDRQGVDGYL